MRNIEELKDLREQGRNLIERKRDEFVRNRFEINKIFKVVNGTVEAKNSL